MESQNSIENKVQVSVLCLTYNHDKYIARSLDSFISQKTSFSFEVIVHDDASTDNTAKIISEYEQKYPDIIKPIYQSENQYSKGVKLTASYLLPKAQGKYIAICEGDDYWCDPYKLQKQYDVMEANPRYMGCVHYANCVDTLTGDTICYMPDKNYKLKNGEVEKEVQLEIILKSLFHVSTVLLKNSVYSDFCYNKSDYIKAMPVGDAALEIYLYMNGTICFIDEVMSVYNKGVDGSFTKRIETNAKEVGAYSDKRMIAFRLFANELDGTAKKRVERFVGDYFVSKNIDENNLSFFENNENKQLLRRINKILLVKYILWRYFPKLLDLYMKSKGRM